MHGLIPLDIIAVDELAISDCDEITYRVSMIELPPLPISTYSVMICAGMAREDDKPNLSKSFLSLPFACIALIAS